MSGPNLTPFHKLDDPEAAILRRLDAIERGTFQFPQLRTSKLFDVAWQAWTPTYTNLTVGDGTVVARYTQLGKTIEAHFTFTLGSTSAVGTNPTVSVPVTASAQYTAGRNNIGNAYIFDSGTQTYPGSVRLGSTTTLSVGVHLASGTYATYANATATVPMTWATGDILHFTATYEAA